MLPFFKKILAFLHFKFSFGECFVASDGLILFEWSLMSSRFFPNHKQPIMGRKKNASKTSDDGHNHQIAPPEIVDLVLDLFDQLGFYGRDCPRTALCIHVGKLRTFVERHNPDKGISQDSLLTVETWLVNTRETALVFLESLEEERTEIRETCEELEDVAGNADLVGWESLAHHIRVQFTKQLELEAKATNEFLSNLDSFYESLLQSSEEMIQSTGRALLKSDYYVKEYTRIESVLRRESLRGNCVLRHASQVFESSNGFLGTFIPPTDQLSIKDTGSRRDLLPENSSPHISSMQNSENDIGALISHFFESPTKQLFASALVIGQQGSGKSHLCDSVAAMYSKSANVLRPRLPLDLLGSSAGEAEDRLIALFGSASTAMERGTIVILDDVDILLSVAAEDGSSSFSSQQGSKPHTAVRLQSTLKSMLDNIPLLLPNDRRMFLLCTCTTNVAQSIARFDHTVHLEEPTNSQRVNLVSKHFGITNHTLLEAVADELVGRSFAEMALLCRETVEDLTKQAFTVESPDWEMQSIEHLRRNLRKASPASLRSGVLGDFVDMTVYSAMDLGVSSTSRPFSLNLYGPDIMWKEIQSSIVVPLCRKIELASLLNKNDHDGQSGDKIVCGGILLVGEPGNGKTMLAFEAARFAASLLPSLTLIDVSCTSLIHKEVGGSEMAVRRMFASARQAAPCILVLDGIENIAGPRGNDTTTEGSMDRILSTLLIEMDGIESNTTNGHGIAIIGISQDERWVDAALKRPGRLSKAVRLGRPDEQSRLQIIQREIPDMTRIENHSEAMMELTRATEGMTGASLVAMCERLTMSLSQGNELSSALITEIMVA